jgi:dsRNA-specific ribonuclease
MSKAINIDKEELAKKVYERFGYEFNDKELLKQSLTCSGLANDLHIKRSDALATIGDLVLSLASTEIDYEEGLSITKGHITEIKESYQKNDVLNEISKDIFSGLISYTNTDLDGDKGYATICEAFLFALYYDSKSIEKVKKFVNYKIKPYINTGGNNGE